MGVTKTDFMRGMQCRKMLWLDKHKPNEKVIPPETQIKLDKGNEFGDSAMGMFGPYVEVTTYKQDGRLDYAQMIEKTRGCISLDVAVICEAAFSYYGHYCAVDILKKEQDGYSIYEVKSSTDYHHYEYIVDVAYQKYVLEKCGRGWFLFECILNKWTKCSIFTLIIH